MSNERSRSVCTSLPKGWIREVVLRKNGSSAGKSDVYYYSPEGRKFRSKPQILQHFGDTLDLSNFEFRSGRVDGSYKNKKRYKERTNEITYRKDFLRPTLLYPKRITKRSVEKKKVTVVRLTPSQDPVIDNIRNDKSTGRMTRAHEKAEAEFQLKKQRVREVSMGKEHCKPKQLFWQKRLQGLNAVDVNSTRPSKSLEIPTEMKSLVPGGNQTTLFHSIISCLHNDIKVVGQNMSLNALRKNPGIWCNPDQPFCSPFVVTTDMVKDQEKKVEMTRKSLSDAVELLKYIQDGYYDSD